MSWMPSIFRNAEETSAKHVYIITCENSEMYKIGRTSGSVEKRLKSLQTGNPNKLGIYLDIKTKKDSDLEAKLHQFFKEKRGEVGEWFALDLKDLKKIKKAYNKCGAIVLDNDNFMKYLGAPTAPKKDEPEGFFRKLLRKIWK